MSSRTPSVSHASTSSKRRRLGGPSSSSSASSGAPRSTSSYHSIINDEDFRAARQESVTRVLSVWERLEARYARAMDEDDIVDLRSGRLVQDKGVLASMERPRHFSRLLDDGGEDEDKDDGATTDGFVTAGEDEENGSGEEDELGLRGENDQYGNDGEPEESSDDELGAWDTIPAPPSDPPSPAEPAVATPVSDAPSSTNAFAFLHTNVRPRLEQLAREREESPLPAAEDLEAFLAAEDSLQAQPGYIEPDGSDEDDDHDPGYFESGGSAYEYEPVTSDAEEVEEGEVEEESDDELNDWDTVPAPPDEEDEAEAADNQESDDGFQLQSEASELEESFAVDAAPTEDESDDEPSVARLIQQKVYLPPRASSPPTTSHLKSKALHQQQLPTPPYSTGASTVSRPGTTSPTKRPVEQTVPTLEPVSKSKVLSSPKKPRITAEPVAGPSKPRSLPNANGRQPDEVQTTRRALSALIPEVVVPTLEDVMSSPAKSKRPPSSPTKTGARDPPSRSGSRSRSPAKQTTSKPRSEQTTNKKRKRDTMDIVEEEGEQEQVVERLGSLGLEDHSADLEDNWSSLPEDFFEPQERRSRSPRLQSPEPINWVHREERRQWHHTEEDERPIASSSAVDPGPSRPQVPRPGPPPPPPAPQPQFQHPNPILQPQYQPTPLPNPFAQLFPSFPQQPMPQAYQYQPAAPPSPAAYMPIVNMLPQPAPMFQYPIQAQPQPSGQEALLTQVLYSLNYLAYQNAAQNSPNPSPNNQVQADGYGPMSPQAYRLGSTPVATIPPRRNPQYAGSDDQPPSPTKSILRVGGSRDREPFMGLGLKDESRRKGKEREVDFGSDADGPRSPSVTFNNPPSVSTPKGQYAPPRRSSFTTIQAPPRPSPLRNVSSFNEGHISHQSPDSSVSSSEQWSSPSPLHSRSRSLHSLEAGSSRSRLAEPNSDTITHSQTVLAKARAALSSSVATTASLGIPKTKLPSKSRR